MSGLTAGPAVECDSCGTQPMNATEAEDETCPLCGEYAREVVVTDCPNGDDCKGDTHDFGTGMHVDYP